MRGLSLCSGVGMLDLAAEWAGIEIVGQVENDPFCLEVLADQRPHVKRMENIKDVQGDEFGPIEIVFGGIPCQGFSVAGLQLGTDDDRYLWPETFRIITTTNATWVVIENVANFLPMVLDIVQPDLESAGYEVQAFSFPACAVDAPHIRQRACIVAHANSTRGDSGGLQFRDESPHTITDNESKDVAHAMHQRYQRDTQTGWQAERGIEYPSGMVNANGARCTERQFATSSRDARGSAWRHAEERIARLSESRLGALFDGATANIRHATQWTSLQGEAQAAWEPKRVVSKRVPNHARRLKAAGNGAVPQLFYRVFAGIMLIESGIMA